MLQTRHHMSLPNSILALLASVFVFNQAQAATAPEAWNDLPVRALLLTAPKPADVPVFCKFIREDLPKEGVNTLVVRFRYEYKFQSHPELADTDALSRDEVKQIVAACKDAGIKLVPKTNLLG